tara:strand:- start:8029 stop:8526 length:498 start_codon:yes stop_codon:yes gene_type:complete
MLTIKYIYPDYPDGYCVYCGEIADTKDHLLPRGFTGEADRLRVPTVPACVECNSTLNAIHMPDVMDRREFLHKKYRTKYKSLLKVVWHGEEDLLDFGPYLRAAIMQRMEDHVILMRRLSWPSSPIYDADAWAGAWEQDVLVEEIPFALQGIKKEPPHPEVPGQGG